MTGLKDSFTANRYPFNEIYNDWNLRVSWYRIGKTRKDFTLQLNLIADPHRIGRIWLRRHHGKLGFQDSARRCPLQRLQRQERA